MSKTNLRRVPAPQARQHEAPRTAFAPVAQSPLHPFGLAGKARAQDDSCGVWMNEMPLLGYIVVRGDAADPAFNHAVKGVLGVELPRTPGRFIAFPHGLALWQTPDEWLLLCAGPARAAYQGELETALAGLHAQVVDNSGGLTTVYVSGESHVALLRHVSVYDIESIGPGQVVSTVCSKAGMTLFRHDAHGLFVVFRRSFSDYVWRLLETAARPYRLGISKLVFRASHPVLQLL
ncbi:MAG: sarcosine oxidase subunit gamma family protein [Pseudomonadota bacterium]